MIAVLCWQSLGPVAIGWIATYTIYQSHVSVPIDHSLGITVVSGIPLLGWLGAWSRMPVIHVAAHGWSGSVVGIRQAQGSRDGCNPVASSTPQRLDAIRCHKLPMKNSWRHLRAAHLQRGSTDNRWKSFPIQQLNLSSRRVQFPPPPLAQIPLSCNALRHARQGDFEFSAVPEGFCAESEQVCLHDCDLQSCSEIAAFPKSKIGTSKMISLKSDVCSSLTWIRQSQ